MLFIISYTEMAKTNEKIAGGVEVMGDLLRKGPAKIP